MANCPHTRAGSNSQNCTRVHVILLHMSDNCSHSESTFPKQNDANLASAQSFLRPTVRQWASCPRGDVRVKWASTTGLLLSSGSDSLPAIDLVRRRRRCPKENSGEIETQGKENRRRAAPLTINATAFADWGRTSSGSSLKNNIFIRTFRWDRTKKTRAQCVKLQTRSI